MQKTGDQPEIKEISIETKALEAKLNSELAQVQPSFLKPIVTDPASPYFTETGIPPTSGDYRQRVLNAVKMPKPRRDYRSFVTGSVLVVGTIVGVYATNIIQVYNREKRLEELLAERQRLTKLLDQSK